MSSLCPAREPNMTTQEDMPHPDNCKWCQEARTCSTSTFITKDLINPLPQPNQTIGEYFRNLCQCGHQTIPSWNLGKDMPEFLPHTTLCKEHTIRWMEKIINLKMKFNPEEYGDSITA